MDLNSMRYWLSFEYHSNHMGRDYQRTQLVGPFSTPNSAKECWDVTYASRDCYRNPAVFYKEFDL